MRIYLDNCCYGRVFDDKTNERVKFEAEATLYIREKIIEDEFELVTSFMIHYENSQRQNEQQRLDIEKFFKSYKAIHVGAEHIEALKKSVDEIMNTGIKLKDAYHVASAIFAECDYFVTVDKRLFNFRSEKIKMINPIELCRIWGEKNAE